MVVFEPPPVLERSAWCPTAVLKKPLVLEESAVFPKALLAAPVLVDRLVPGGGIPGAR